MQLPRSVERARRALEPGRPAELALRAARRYVEDGMPDRAASVAYYGMLSLFPILLIAFGIIRVVGGADAPDDLYGFAEDHGVSGVLAETVRAATDTAREASPSGAGLVGVAGVLLLVYGASRAFTAVGRALDATGGRAPNPRSPVRRAKDIGWTLALVLMGAAFVVLVLVSGRLLRDFLGLFGLSGVGVTVWSILRWPAAALLLLLAFALVRWTAPTATRTRFRLLSPGAVVAAGAWLAASAGYGAYLSTIATYNATYGTFAGSVILLLWIWLSAGAFLYGAELDAVREEGEG